MAQRLMIIGAGMAAGRLVERLSLDHAGAYDITLFNAEPRGTYNRIMLSPVLSGEKSYDEIVTHDDAWYGAHGVTCRFGEQVTGIDVGAKTVTGENGAAPYDRLVIATGSSPFIIPLPGRDLEGVIAYRDLEDTEAMIEAAEKPQGKAVVIGGGLLGLEAAAGLAARGMQVTVVHLMGHLMERQLDEAAGFLLRKALTDRGIKVICGANSREILGENGHVRALALEDGRELPCDLLVMAVGIRPNTGLAIGAGIEVARGIVVDDQMRTNLPDVYGLGECVEHGGALFGLVAPLYDQAEVLATHLTGGQAAFAPKEVSTKLKVTGCDLFSAGDFAAGEGREEITLRDPRGGNYKRLVLEQNRLVGAVMYGDTNDSNWFFNLIQSGADVGAMREQLLFGPAHEGASPLEPYGGRCSLTG